MKAREIREKTLEEIKDDLTAAEENLRTLHYQHVTNQLEKTSAVKISKRNIARLKTILREHELGVHPLHSTNKTASVEV
jgi:large subunit ribosomal protein L29